MDTYQQDGTSHHDSSFPLIGITGMRHMIPSKVSAQNLLGVASPDDYAQGVEAAGGLPLVIPYLADDTTVMALAKRLDGLVLAGGEDVDPLLFHEEPQRGLGTVVPERDRLEVQLAHYMVQQNKPIFGICRGMQVMAAAFGGTLYQDLLREWGGSIAHRQRAARNHLSHHVTVRKGSQLHACMEGEERILCNSFHHQAVRQVPPGWDATAWDDDGLVEAMERPGSPLLLAVQWHPENLWRYDEHFLNLFRALVEAAK